MFANVSITLKQQRLMNNYFGNISSEHCCNHAHGKVKISITCFTKNPARKNNLEIPSGFSLFLLIQIVFSKELDF